MGQKRGEKTKKEDAPRPRILANGNAALKRISEE